MLIRFAIQKFYAEKRYENVTGNTIKVYQFTLIEFEKYADSVGVDNVRNISSRVFKCYILQCKERGNNAVTLNSKAK